MSKQWTGLVLVGVMTASCSVPLPGIHGVQLLTTSQPVAVGARVDGLVLACANELSFADSVNALGFLFAAGYGALDTRERPSHGYVPGCGDLDYTVTDITVEGASFTVEPHPTVEHGLRFSAVAPGDSTVSVTVRTAKETRTVSATLSAAEVSHVEISGACDEQVGVNELPRVSFYPNQQLQQITTWLEDTAGHRLAGYDYRGAVFEGFSPAPQELFGSYYTSATADVAQVLVPGEPSSSFRESLYSSTDVFDGLRLSGTTPPNFMVGDSTSVRALPTIDGGLPCRYLPVESAVDSLTPEVCVAGVGEPDGGLSEASAVPPTVPVRVVATGPGECRLRAHRANHTADLSMQVQRGWVTQAVAPPAASFHALWGTSASNVYLASDEVQPDAGLSYPWPDAGLQPCTRRGAPCGDVKAAVFHFDGTSLTKLDVPAAAGEARAIWGSGPAEVFVVGEFGIIFHFDGGAWTRMSSGTEAHLYAIAGSGPTDVWASGATTLNEPVFLHYDGSRWSSSPPLERDQLVTSLWFESPTSGYATTDGTRYHWDGSAWSVALSSDGGSITNVSGTGRDDVWTFGTRVSHFDGNTWTNSTAVPTGCGYSGWVASPSEVFLYGSHVCRFDGLTWSRLTDPPETFAPGASLHVWAMWSANTHEVFALTSTRLWRLIRE